MKRSIAVLFATGAGFAALSAPVLLHAEGMRSDGVDALSSIVDPSYNADVQFGAIPGDNLGNHMAEGSLDMRGHPIVDIGPPPSMGNDGYAVSVGYLRDYVSVYGSDNLGDHVARQTLRMGDFPIEITAQPLNDDHAANKAYVDAQVSAMPGSDNLGDHSADQNLSMNDFRITGIHDPSNAKDAVNLRFMETFVQQNGDHLGNHVALQDLDMSGFGVINLPEPVEDAQAATKLYVDGRISGNGDAIGELRDTLITAGAGLSGGGPLSSGVTLSFDTGWGDGRYALASRTVTGTDGVSGGGPLTGDQVLRVDATVVRTAGAQTITGTKTFGSTIEGNISGNAGAAARLQTPRTINGIPFDGSAGIELPTVNISGSQRVIGQKTFVGSMISEHQGDPSIRMEIHPHRIASNGSLSLRVGSSREVQITDDAGNPTGSTVNRPSAGFIDFDRNSGSVIIGVNRSHPRNLGWGEILSVTADNVASSRDIHMRRAGANAGLPGGNIVMNGGRVIGLEDPADGSDAVNLRSAQRIVNDMAVTVTRDQAIDGEKSFTSQIRAPGFVTTSDARLKHDIRDADFTGIIDRLRPVTFTYNADGRKSFGFIAQEVEEILPAAVATGPDGFKAVDYSLIVSPLVAAIQDMQRQIVELERDLAEIRADGAVHR
ncbi:tail fiber domain-containing protein [Paracoccus sp. ME4]|uniref:tail fiber domain-containing protein n=1 Tax=Paracoccus sp. ME4 TaxID=3138066 RepID=UPI00398BB9B1